MTRASGGPLSRADVRASYDRVAGEYARRVAGELAHKPLDRALLDQFADRVRGAHPPAPGPAADVGCGPGHVTRYLAERGVDAFGLDLSPGMVEQARALHPGLRFDVGDVTRLDAPDGAWAGAIAYYSLIHLPRAAVAAALRELARALRPGAPLLVAFHVGDGTGERTRRLDEWWGPPVRLRFAFFGADEMAGSLREAGFVVEAVAEREPYPDVEAPTRRAYVLAATLAGAQAPPSA